MLLVLYKLTAVQRILVCDYQDLKLEDHTTNTPMKESPPMSRIGRSFILFATVHRTLKVFGAGVAGAFLRITWRIDTLFEKLKPGSEDVRGSCK